MCTLMTISNELFASDPETYINQLLSDFKRNEHGCSLVLLGTDQLAMQSKNIYAIIDLLHSCDWDRAFIHCRFSTSIQKGLGGCHAFYSASYTSVNKEGWHIMHNGILGSEQSRKYRVDSQYIAEMVDHFGVKTAAAYTLTQGYANVFFIDTYSDSYIVTRSTAGTLFTDGLGNYSTNSVGTMINPVLDDTNAEYIKEKPTPVYNTGWKYSSDYGLDNTGTVNYNSTDGLPGTTVVAVITQIPDDPVDFMDWVYDNHYDHLPIPKEVSKVLTKAQKIELLSIKKIEWQYRKNKNGNDNKNGTLRSIEV